MTEPQVGFCMNKRITVKERNLLKGAIRRVFSRSELRRKIMDTAKVVRIDATRPRVKNWYSCKSCNGFYAQYEMQVDHTLPIIRLDEAFENVSLDTVVDRLWCEEWGLQPICVTCHKVKSKQENKLRREHRKNMKGKNK